MSLNERSEETTVLLKANQEEMVSPGEETMLMARFCTNCGTPLSNGNPVCEKCGNVNSPVKVNAGTLAFLSKRMEANAPETIVPVETEKHSFSFDRKGILIVGCGALIILALAAVLLWNILGTGSGTKGMGTSAGIDSDIDEIANRINITCHGIADNVSDGSYQRISINEGTKVYYEDDGIALVMADQGYEDEEYKLALFYSNDQVIYAQYRGTDAHDFFFDNESLIRWTYYPAAGTTDGAENYERSDRDDYTEWEDRILSLTDQYKGAWQDAIEGSETVQDTAADVSSSAQAAENEGDANADENINDDSAGFIFPDSDSRYISEDELKNLSQKECATARNEIFARHGRKFKDADWREYFSQFDWYTPSVEPDDFSRSVLNSYENKNLDLIIEYEKSQGYR